MKKRLLDLGKLAHQLKKRGKLKEAEETYNELLNLDRYNTYALVGIGDLKRRARAFDAAIAFTGSAFRLKVTTGTPLWTGGRLPRFEESG